MLQTHNMVVTYRQQQKVNNAFHGIRSQKELQAYHWIRQSEKLLEQTEDITTAEILGVCIQTLSASQIQKMVIQFCKIATMFIMKYSTQAEWNGPMLEIILKREDSLCPHMIKSGNLQLKKQDNQAMMKLISKAQISISSSILILGFLSLISRMHGQQLV